MSGKDPASTSSGQHNEYLQRAYALDSVDAARELYSEWAKDYDGDLAKHKYASPQASVDVFWEFWTPSNDEQSISLTVLDAGCGTGLVGECIQRSLQPKVHLCLDGVDLTPGMMEVARKKGVYRALEPADLNEMLRFDASVYDAVFCVGTLTKGHVGPKCFAEFARVTKPGGLVVATVHDEIWESHGYQAAVDDLGRNGAVQVISTAKIGILQGETQGGRMVVLKRK